MYTGSNIITLAALEMELSSLPVHTTTASCKGVFDMVQVGMVAREVDTTAIPLMVGMSGRCHSYDLPTE